MANGKTIYEDKIEIKLLERVISSLKERHITYGFESAYSEAISELNDQVKASFKTLNLNLPPQNKEFHKTTGVYQMWCFCDEVQVEELKCINPEFDFVKWMTVGYDIIKKGESKGKGLVKLAAYLGYEPQDIIAFGDGENDIEMIKTAGLGIAMGNGTINLKQNSKYITTNIDNDGIYKALKHFNII